MHISFVTPSNPLIPTPKVHQLNEEYGAKTVLKNTLKRSSKLNTLPTQKTDRTEQRFLLCVPCPFRKMALIPSWCVIKGWLGPWLCKDECCAEALMITTNNTTKWSWKEHETTTNSTKNSVLDFLMLITCDPPLWSTLNWYVQSLPDLALEVSLKYQGCSATLNALRIKGHSVYLWWSCLQLRRRKQKSIFWNTSLLWLIKWKHTWMLNFHYYMRAYVYIGFESKTSRYKWLA